ncbi:MAG: hypothetical protein GY792_14420 [Gammaproteobacteria bacterium]|nr:hypothetical protein [Gammaproteobacteria bacterium]
MPAGWSIILPDESLIPASIQCPRQTGRLFRLAGIEPCSTLPAKLVKNDFSIDKNTSCRYGIGVDIVDVEAAYEHGMVVTNVPDYCLDEVADHSITLGLMLLRRIPFFVNAAKAGKWH